MHIVRGVALTLFNILLLYMLIVLLGQPDAAYFGGHQDYRFGKGNASETVRAQILQQLIRFQDGYSRRDTSLLQSHATELLSSDDILILGTMPLEIRTTFNRAVQLIEEDWRSWGDCRFLMENAHISASGDTAWFATLGTVRMDGIGLVLPLRLSGVMENENGTWKFRQIQFQFDMDLSWLLLVEALLLMWLGLNVTLLVVRSIQAFRTRPA